MKNYIEKELAIDNSTLKEIWLSNRYTMVPSGVLDSVSGIVSSIIVPYPVRRICNSAFRGCDELISVSLPDSLCSIGSAAFFGCSKLESITIPSNVSDISYSAFSQCWNLTSVTILGSVLPNFKSCRKISSITIGDNLKDFNIDSFSNCKNIHTIIVDKKNKYYDSRENCNAIIETISDTLLFACNSTKIPEGIKHIKGPAFWNCGRIKTLSLPGSLETIDRLPENVKIIFVPIGRKQYFKKILPWTNGIELVEE